MKLADKLDDLIERYGYEKIRGALMLSENGRKLIEQFEAEELDDEDEEDDDDEDEDSPEEE